MDIPKKLAQWQEAGLIDGATRARIQAHEGQRRRPIVLYAMLGLGALTVGLGVISVVAANWDGIGDGVKLGVDLLLAVALGVSTFWASDRRKPLATDVLVVIYYVFTLASIALVGQVYQLGAPTYQALLTWSVVTAPLVWLGHSRWLGTLWCVGLTWTFALVCEAALELIDEDALRTNLGVALAGGYLLASFAATRAFVVSRRPMLAAGVHAMLRLSLLACAFACTLPWYEHVGGHELLGRGVVLLGALGLAGHLSLPWLLPETPQRVRRGVSAMLAIAWLSLAAGTTFERAALDAIGGLLQLGLLMALAWTAAQAHALRAFNTLTGLIALRLLVIYFEVFGSMLDTGVGMITGGVLTLLMAWVWRRRSPSLARQLGGGAS